MRFKVGDKVIFNNHGAHERLPEIYPVYGTVGTVLEVEQQANYCIVEWTKGSVSFPKMVANFGDLINATEWQIAIPEAAPIQQDIPAEVETLVSHICKGKECAKSRKALAWEMNKGDRETRELVSLARKYGIPIINVGRGYYIPDTDDEKEQYVRQEYNRAMSILTNIAPMRRELKAIGRDV